MLSICVQAGGQSRRMGQNKSLLEFKGQNLTSRIISRVSRIADEIFVISNAPEQLSFLDVPVYKDLNVGSGPLVGLYSALTFARCPYLINIACDMPFINADVLFYELELARTRQVDVVMPCSEKGPEPLHAVYRRENCLQPVKASIKNGNKRLISWMDQVEVYEMPVNEIKHIDPELHSFLNINTQEELIKAGKLIHDEK